MGKGRRKDVRIGDTERQQAIRLLGEHFSAGRLDLTEYDERCQQSGMTQFRSQLAALFDDLPAPHPDALRGVETATPNETPRSDLPVRKVALIIGVAALGVLSLLIFKQVGLIILLPLIAVLLFSTRR